MYIIKGQMVTELGSLLVYKMKTSPKLKPPIYWQALMALGLTC